MGDLVSSGGGSTAVIAGQFESWDEPLSANPGGSVRALRAASRYVKLFLEEPLGGWHRNGRIQLGSNTSSRNEPGVDTQQPREA
jgi:hypothetical protein